MQPARLRAVDPVGGAGRITVENASLALVVSFTVRRHAARRAAAARAGERRLGANTSSRKLPGTEFARWPTRTGSSPAPSRAAELVLGLPARLPTSQPTGASCERVRWKTSTTASRSPCAARRPRCGARAAPGSSTRPIRAAARTRTARPPRGSTRGWCRWRRRAARAARGGAVVVGGRAAWARAEERGGDDEQERMQRRVSARRDPNRWPDARQSGPQSFDRLRLEPVHGRALEHVAVGAEARAVARAVPAALGGVPVDLAAEVGAARRDRDAASPSVVAVGRRPSRRRERTMSPSPGARSSSGRVPRLVTRSPTMCRPTLRVLLARSARRSARGVSAVRVEQRRPRVRRGRGSRRRGSARRRCRRSCPTCRSRSPSARALANGRHPADVRQRVDRRVSCDDQRWSTDATSQCSRGERLERGVALFGVAVRSPAWWPSPPTSSSSSPSTRHGADRARGRVGADEHPLGQRAVDPAGDRVGALRVHAREGQRRDPGTGSGSRRRRARR